MQTPDNEHPLYSLSGCLDSEVDTCIECGCQIYHRNESDDPDFCIICFTLEKIMSKMRERYIKIDMTCKDDKDCKYLYQNQLL